MFGSLLGVKTSITILELSCQKRVGPIALSFNIANILLTVTLIVGLIISVPSRLEVRDGLVREICTGGSKQNVITPRPTDELAQLLEYQEV